MYLGLSREVALSCFDHSLYGERVLQMGVKEPVLLESIAGVQVHELIGTKDTPCFAMTRYTCAGGSAKLTRGAAVYIVTRGEGALTGEGYSRQIKAGNYFFLPAEAKGYSICGDVQFVCCQGGE